jgi:hypothetical protein
MKTMTVEEIMACKIPEGPYKLALDKVREHIDSDNCHEFYLDQNTYKSLCAAFTALMELAKGKYPGLDEWVGDSLINDCVGIASRKAKKDTISSVRGIVNEMIEKEKSFFPKYRRELYSSFVEANLTELLNRIAALESKK